MTGLTLIVVAGLVGYLLGSVPSGLLLLRAMGAPDPRTMGSGNIGATNVARAGGRGVGLTTLVLDVTKGVLPVLFFGARDPRAGAVAGLAAVLGHCHPVWLRFSGGKGVATFLGACAALAFPVAPLAFVLTWGMLVAATRLVSVASVAACCVAAIAALVSGGSMASWPGWALVMAALLVTMRHRANFARIRRGEEPRMGRGRQT